MERETGAQRVVMDDREGVVIERESASVKVRWDDGTEEWVALVDLREQAASSDVPERELGS